VYTHIYDISLQDGDDDDNRGYNDTIAATYVPVASRQCAARSVSVMCPARARLYHVISGCGMPNTLHVMAMSRPSCTETSPLDNLSLIDAGTMDIHVGSFIHIAVFFRISRISLVALLRGIILSMSACEAIKLNFNLF